MIEIWDGQSDLRPLAEAWAKEIGYDADIDCAVEDLNLMLNDPDSDVLVLYGDKAIEFPAGSLSMCGYPVFGGMGITTQSVSHTRDLYSAVRYWYILPGHRHKAMSLIIFAKQWSKEKGCAKMMIVESKHVPCGDFYERMGFKVHETVYIGDL